MIQDMFPGLDLYLLLCCREVVGRDGERGRERERERERDREGESERERQWVQCGRPFLLGRGAGCSDALTPKGPEKKNRPQIRSRLVKLFGMCATLSGNVSTVSVRIFSR